MTNTLTNDLLEIKPLVNINIIEETLTRMGIAHIHNKVLYQSAHIYEQFGSYYLMHFKQLFVIGHTKNGMPGYGNVSVEDIQRRNTIALYLKNWNMIEIISPINFDNRAPKLFVLPHQNKDEWTLVKKYHVANLKPIEA